MNKGMLAVVIILATAVVLLSGTVFYMSQCKCQGLSCSRFSPDNRMNARMPFPPGQERTMPGNMQPMPNAGGQSEVAPPSGQPNFMGGNQQGQRPPDMQNMGGNQQGQRLQGRQNMGGSQGQGQQSGPGMSRQLGQGQTGSREQVSQIMQEAMQEAQNYFKSHNRTPEHEEMMSKVKELATQKMNAQGISQDVQQQVLSRMSQSAPPQQPQQQQ